MHYYNNKNFFKILFSFNYRDTVKILLPALLGIAIYSGIIAYLEVEYFKLSENSSIKGVNLLYTLLSFVLSLLLVFRTNTAYDRWWEGRKLWGKLVNDSRNLSVKIDSILPLDDAENRDFFRKSISSFPYILAGHLSEESTILALDQDYIISHEISKEHGPIELVSLMMERAQKLKKEGVLSDVDVLYLDTQLTGFLEVCGGCERIKNTPIPFSYSSFIKKFIILYTLALPIANVLSIGYLIIPLTVFVFYVLMSLEVIAEEIEDPFSNDENDLPLQQLANNIERNVSLIIK